MIAKVIVDLKSRSDMIGVWSILEVVSYDYSGKRIQDYPDLIDGDEFHSYEEGCSWVANELNVPEDIVEIGEIESFS